MVFMNTTISLEFFLSFVCTCWWSLFLFTFYIAKENGSCRVYRLYSNFTRFTVSDIGACDNELDILQDATQALCDSEIGVEL